MVVWRVHSRPPFPLSLVPAPPLGGCQLHGLRGGRPLRSGRGKPELEYELEVPVRTSGPEPVGIFRLSALAVLALGGLPRQWGC